MKIRPARADDARAFATIRIASWRDSFQELVPPATLDALAIEPDAERFAKWLARPEFSSFTLEEGGEVVGFCMLRPSRDSGERRAVAEIPLLYLAAEARGKGGGRALLELAIATARDRDFEEVTLWVLEGNIRARGFYERMGMRPDGATQSTSEMPGAVLKEVRYRIPTDREVQGASEEILAE